MQTWLLAGACHPAFQLSTFQIPGKALRVRFGRFQNLPSCPPPTFHPRPPACRRMYGCQPLRGDAIVDADENSYGVAFCPAGLVISNVVNPTYGANGQYSTLSYM